MLVQEISPLQRARMVAALDAAFARVLDPRPLDRSQAEAAIEALYASAGRAAPAMVWVDSPAAAGAFVNLRNAIAADTAASPVLAGLRSLERHVTRYFDLDLNRLVSALPGSSTFDPAANLRLAARAGEVKGAGIAPERAATPAAEVSSELVTGLGAAIWGDAFAAASDSALITARDALVATYTRNLIAKARDAQVATDWAAALSLGHPGRESLALVRLLAALDIFGLPMPEAIAETAAAWRAVARDVDWFFPFDDVVILVEAPTAVRLDETGRLHCEDGPALAYGEGLRMWCWHGTAVPGHIIEEPAKLTARRVLGIANVEVRRVAFEVMGAERVMREAQARLVHTDECGELFTARVTLSNRSWADFGIVRVVNHSPEPDGTFAIFHLFVPDGLRTARAAVAWTFGLTEAEYAPDAQS